MSEALIFASSNPEYDDRLFIELRVQYMGRTCVHKLFWHSKQLMYTTCSPHVLSLQFSCTYWTCNSMNNLLSHFALTDARIGASEKDLPVFSKS